MAQQTFQLSGDEVAALYEKLAFTFMEPFVESIVDAVDIKDDERLLDVACGTGYCAREVRRRSKTVQIDAVDLNQSMLNVARHIDSSVKWSHAAADHLPFDDEMFDSLICQQGIQFFPDATAATNEMARVLKPSGRVAVTMWAPFEKCPYFDAQADALDKFINKADAESVRMAVRYDSDTYLRDAFDANKFDIDIQLIEQTIHIDDIADFACQQIAGTPWRESFLAAGKDKQDAFGRHMAEALNGFNNEVPFGSWLLIARPLK